MFAKKLHRKIARIEQNTQTFLADTKHKPSLLCFLVIIFENFSNSGVWNALSAINERLLQLMNKHVSHVSYQQIGKIAQALASP